MTFLRTRMSSGGWALCLSVALFAAVSSGPAEADVYLQRSDTGGLVLTDHPGEGSVRLIVESDTVDRSGAGVVQRAVREATREYNLPGALLYAVIHAESGGETAAASHAGALGLMQLMPATARAMGVEDPLDPHQNVLGGARYLNRLLERYDGRLRLALAAYNAGPGRIEKHGGVPPFPETRRFLERVRRSYDRFNGEDRMIYTYRDEDGVLNLTDQPSR